MKKHVSVKKYRQKRMTLASKHHYGSAIIAAAGIIAIFGILLYNPQPVAYVTAGASEKVGFDFYCGYDSGHDLLMCAPELSRVMYVEIVGLTFAQNMQNNILAIYYNEKDSSAAGEVQIYYDNVAVAFTCQESENACRQGYGKACIVRSLCPS